MSLATLGKNFALGISRSVEPVLTAFTNRLSLRGFMYRLGWDISITDSDVPTIENYFGIANAFINVKNIIEDIEEGNGDEIALLEALIPTLEDTIDLVKKLGQSSSGALPAPFNGANNFWNEFPEDLLNWLVISSFEKQLPTLYTVLYSVGIFDKKEETPAGTFRVPYLQYIVEWDRLGDLFTDPLGLIQETYQWGTTDFDFKRFLYVLDDSFDKLGFPVRVNKPTDTLLNEFYLPTNPHYNDIRELNLPFLLEIGESFNTFAEVGFKLMPIPEKNTPSGGPVGFLLTPQVVGSVSGSPNPDAAFQLILSAGFDASGAFRTEIRPTGTELVIDPGITTIDTAIGIQTRPEEPYILIGTENSHRLELEGFFFSIGVKGRVDDLEVIAKVGTGEDADSPKLRAVIQASEGDGFLNKVLGENPIEIDLGGYIQWSSKSGITFNGSVGFDIQIDLHLNLGPFEITNLSLGAHTQANGGFALPVSAGIKLKLGPFSASVEEMGFQMLLQPGTPNEKPILGNLGLDFGFKPPKGVGLSLDTGVVKGGGFLKFYPDQGRYDGILQLSIKDVVNVIAIGLIATKGPNGEEGQFSLLLMITAEFTPIQLSFGFTLNGVGGIIAVNRSMDLEALRVGVRAKTLDNILFPSDPIANATQIISDLETIFPQVQRRYAFGLMGKLGWGTPTLMTLELGLVLEVPNPVKLAILGVIKMTLPTEEEAILKLQVNFLGTIDFEAQYITFDASLFDSKLLTFTLEGDMALRIKWGDNSNFLFTVGGFHPSYTPPPLNLPNMRRLSIGLLTGNPRLTVSTYFAVTSNTVQFGAAVDFYFKVSKFKVIGYLHFDALFQFDPFYFNISLAAGLGVYVGSSEILSIHLSGMLEGPTPWHITGRVKFKIFWVVSISVSVETTWGETKDTTLPDIEVLPKLKEALENKANWLTPLEANGENPDHLVNLRTIENTDEDIIAHPNRSLSVSQKVVPLDMNIEKFGTQNPADYTHFTLDMVASDGELLSEKQLKEEFAPDSFFKLKESERLSRPSFEKYNSGIEGTGSSELTSDYFRERDVIFEQKILDEPDPVVIPVRLAANEFRAFIKGGSAAKSAISARQTRQPVLAPNAVAIANESISIANVNDMSLFEGNQFPSVMEAQEAISSLIAERPDLEDQLEVVPTFELV